MTHAKKVQNSVAQLARPNPSRRRGYGLGGFLTVILAAWIGWELADTRRRP